VTDELAVHISRDELHAIEVPSVFETDGSFRVRLINHARSLHVHLHLSDGLSEVASIDAPNHHVESNSERVVRVDVVTDRLDGENLLGKLKIVSAYGAQTRWIDVRLSGLDVADGAVEVGESLTTPPSRDEPENSPGSVLGDTDTLVGGLAVLAAVVAAVAAFLLESTLVVLGGIAVLAGVAVAFLLLLSQ
jgi:hypothetical protein